jgi:hypothetical protein
MNELPMAQNLDFLKVCFICLFNTTSCHIVGWIYAFSPPITFPRILQPSISVQMFKLKNLKIIFESVSPHHSVAFI